MWFRRRRRRQPPPVFLSALDRLTELIESVVALLDQVTLAPGTEPAPTPPANPSAPAPSAPPRSELAPAVADPSAARGHVVFVSSPDGYRLLQRDGPAPDRGAALELDEGVHLVLRLGPSPLPGDRRRCAFVERQEPAAAERNDDR
jgi:hypothetical protein